MLQKKFISYIVEHDEQDFYKHHLAHVSAFAYDKKIKYGSKDPDEQVSIEALKIAFKALHEAENIQKNAAFEKESKNFLNKLVLKTLKIAQASLAVLLFKTPLRVAVAYNALHFVIKYLEKEIEKIEPKKK